MKQEPVPVFPGKRIRERISGSDYSSFRKDAKGFCSFEQAPIPSRLDKADTSIALCSLFVHFSHAREKEPKSALLPRPPVFYNSPAPLLSFARPPTRLGQTCEHDGSRCSVGWHVREGTYPPPSLIPTSG